MFIFVDIAYFLALPFLLGSAVISRLKGHAPRKNLAARLGYGSELPSHDKRVLIHAVSVGEVNAIRRLVDDLSNQSYDVVICVTTDTGIARAQELFSKKHTVTRFPFDFSFAMKRFLRRMKPTVIALVELEVWPNNIHFARKMGVPVVVINGRLSTRSFKRYRLVKPLLRNTFKKLSIIGMQTDLYANRVRELGGNDVRVLGTMKWDNGIITGAIDGSSKLAKELGIDKCKPLIVAGSTTPMEDKLLRNSIPDGIQLMCAPRKPEWFEDSAKILHPCNRRTSSERVKTNYFLLDTIGELDQAFDLADIVVIGRSFSPLHGSDPVQAIACGKPTIIGPNVSDFEEMVSLLLKGGGILQCTQGELPNVIKTLLENNGECKMLIKNGRKIISEQQGATTRYEQLIAEATPDG